MKGGEEVRTQVRRKRWRVGGGGEGGRRQSIENRGIARKRAVQTRGPKQACHSLPRVPIVSCATESTAALPIQPPSPRHTYTQAMQSGEGGGERRGERLCVYVVCVYMSQRKRE